MMRFDKGNRGQVTIFILLAIVIVSIALAFVFWVKPTYLSDEVSGPQFDNCISDVVEQSINTLSKNGGYIAPEFTYQHNGENFVYLCFSEAYYTACTVQQPLLKQHFENEVERDVRDKINLCYTNSLEDLKDQGYEVTSGNVEYQISFEPSVVRVELDAPTTLGDKSFKKFNIAISSPIYDTVMIAMDIIQSETQEGDADTSIRMLYYPEFIIDKLKQGDGTTLYIIQNKLFNNKFQFASRSYAWPAGYLA